MLVGTNWYRCGIGCGTILGRSLIASCCCASSNSYSGPIREHLCPGLPLWRRRSPRMRQAPKPPAPNQKSSGVGMAGRTRRLTPEPGGSSVPIRGGKPAIVARVAADCTRSTNQQPSFVLLGSPLGGTPHHRVKIKTSLENVFDPAFSRPT